MSSTAPTLATTLAQRVADFTNRRVNNLSIEFSEKNGGRVVIRGRTNSYYVKQLAQHAVREALPTTHLENAIVVD